MSEKRLTVLVVDDVPANIQVLHRVLKQDYRVIYATHGTEALEVAIAKMPDLILLDVIMPDMDGYEVCRRLKQDSVTCDIPVIFVTALGEEEDEARGLELGAIDYITKPISPPIVQVRVKNHLELKGRGDRLRELSYKDGLTGIDNRRLFDETLEREWRRCIRNERPLSLILIDVDHFKAYNDHYGHLRGDDCLRHIARAMDDAVQRPTDHLARYGGEEFVCLLAETDAAGAELLAERLRQVVLDLAIEHKYSPVGDTVTISLGVATMTPTAEDLMTRLIERADLGLYRAKEGGRNRSCSLQA